MLIKPLKEGIMKNKVLFSGIAHSEHTVDYWILNDGDMFLEWDYTPSLNIKLIPFVFYEDEWYEVTNVTFKTGFYDYKRTLNKNVPLIKELQGQYLEFEVQEPKPAEPKPEKGSTYEEAIASLESQGIFNPTVPEILTEMGFTVGEVVGWFNDSKGSETNQSLFIKGRRQDTPKYGECFMDQRFYVISSSKKRAIFTNAHVYIVDSPLYGHALYIFDDYDSALKWAENKLTFKEATQKALLRVVHNKGWKALVAEALRGW